ncbi:retrovirus-related Pol polyprotein from transposon TNT 1-94 [Trichonephila clavipes]|nr:retrovirus-related Pol polyprotein from transposon TNT 1-94 [Trichonephila clavipes]
MVLAVNGIEFPIEGKGDVQIWFNGHECLLRNVFFSSRLRKKLMSGPMLDPNGLKFIDENGQNKVYFLHKLSFQANLQGLHYAYRDIEPKYASSVKRAIKIEGKPNDLLTWHERFGHANVDYILKTSRLDAKRERGIKHKKTNTYAQQQNGTPKCLNRMVIDGARTVLSESGLDKSFWPEAVLYFVYVWNRLCHSGQILKPIELYIGIKPSIRHLRPFGSILYVGIPRPLRGKVDPKAKKGILLGFALGTRGYRVWILEDSKVTETSNVSFQKPQQSNSAAVLASPRLKFSDYKMVENGDDEDLGKADSSVKTTWRCVVVPRAIYTLSQKNICTQKKSSYNHETRQECSLVRDMQMIKISKPMRQG